MVPPSVASPSATAAGTTLPSAVTNQTRRRRSPQKRKLISERTCRSVLAAHSAWLACQRQTGQATTASGAGAGGDTRRSLPQRPQRKVRRAMTGA